MSGRASDPEALKTIAAAALEYELNSHRYGALEELYVEAAKGARAAGNDAMAKRFDRAASEFDQLQRDVITKRDELLLGFSDEQLKLINNQAKALAPTQQAFGEELLKLITTEVDEIRTVYPEIRFSDEYAKDIGLDQEDLPETDERRGGNRDRRDRGKGNRAPGSGGGNDPEFDPKNPRRFGGKKMTSLDLSDIGQTFQIAGITLTAENAGTQPDAPLAQLITKMMAKTR